MKNVSVLVEYSALNLDQTFTYTCSEPVQPGCRVRVNFHQKDVIGMVKAVDVPDEGLELKPVLEVIDPEPLLNTELSELAEHLRHITVSSWMAVWKAMLPPALKPASTRSRIILEDWFVPGTPSGQLTKKGQAAYERFLPELPMKASEFRKKTKTLWKSMLEHGDIVLEKREKQPELARPTFQENSPLQLNACQKQALEKIRSREEGVFLLHGVTGSGKTEVFLQLAADALAQGKQVLFLVPEIGLTPMMISRVTSRFGDRVAIYHSRLSAQEKYDQYMQVKNGRFDIVVGTRSAVFMPFDHLGLILMDEEHDSSYKQDSAPRYHARDAALFRSRYHHCRLILASATPSLESYARAIRHVYELVKMPVRVHQNSPAVYPVDLRRDRVQDGLSATLIQAIRSRLARKEQVILLLNRRGYYPSMRCLSCGEVIKCPDCDIPMAYHKNGRMLVCHVCGHTRHFDFTCPSCGSHHFATASYGTEKMEETLHSLFPAAHVVRMDADSTRSKHAHATLLKEFEERGDILLGTQMVAKGLDFERVTLVGILCADNALIRQDYRAAETAYELIEQAAGRSGRSARGGEVLIQTFDETHYVMQAVLNHSYKIFFEKEMGYRHLGQYPPYVYLCSLVFSHSAYDTAFKTALAAKKELAAVTVLGPVDISMRQKKYRIRLVLKDRDEERLLCAVWNLRKWYRESRQKAGMEINMNPVMLEE